MSEEKIRLYYKNAIIERYRLRVQLTAAREALEEIEKGEGAFSADSLTHATNTIESMKGIAVEALTKLKEENPG